MTNQTLVFDTEDGILYFQACSLKGMLKLHLKGLRGRCRVRDVLATAASITGKGPYTTGKGIQQAVDDLQAWIDERKS